MELNASGKRQSTLKNSPMRGLLLTFFVEIALLAISLFMPLLLFIAVPGIVILPFMGFLTKSGQCPNCHAMIMFFGTIVIKCRTCKHRIKREGNIAIDIT